MNTNTKAPVYLLRHARTSLNADGRLRGHLDPPLDDVGRAEAAALAGALATLRPVRIYSSPLRRAVETASVLAARLGVDIVTDPRLVDRDYGPWAGSTEGDVISQYGSLDDAPGVEPAAAVRTRARELLDSVVDALDDGPVVLLAHDAINRALLADLAPVLAAGGPIAQHTACWNMLLRDGDGWHVDRVNQVAAV